MPGLEFSLPYNGDPRVLDAQLALNGLGGNRVREVYLNVPQEVAGSGRAGGSDRMTEERFVRVVERVHAAGVRVDMTMNATCGGSEWYSDEQVGKLVGFVRRMHEERGVEAVTLANPFHIERVREACPDIEISASVLAEIDCVQRAQAFADAGATTFTPATSVNRDLALLREMSGLTGLEVKLMVNEGCLYKCPYRLFHMNLISHRSQESRPEGEAFSFACGERIEKDPAELFRSGWVRPEDERRYAEAGAARFFKVVGRDMLASKVMRACSAYMAESYDGNLLDLLCSSAGFYNVEKSACVDNKALGESGMLERLFSCDHRCHECDHCSELAARFLRYGWVTEENLRDMGQGRLADMVKARFGGRYPKCPDMSEQPRPATAAPSASAPAPRRTSPLASAGMPVGAPVPRPRRSAAASAGLAGTSAPHAVAPGARPSAPAAMPGPSGPGGMPGPSGPGGMPGRAAPAAPRAKWVQNRQ